MNIKQATTDNKLMIYNLTHSISTGKVSDLEGQTIQPVAWAYYEDVDKQTGETKDVLSFVLEDTEVYGTISRVFIETFLEMADALGDNVAFTVKTGTSKAGRKFIFPVPAEIEN